jgi:succinate dehydrogenase / fumarate reductase cytochrome b subunit
MNPILKLWQSTIGKKIAMAVSGLLLVGFLVTHVVSNLTIFTDPAHLDAWGRFLRSTGPLLWIARGGLIALAVIHVVAATQLTLLDRKARPAAYAAAPGKGSRWLALGMRLGGFVLLAFLVIHLMNLTWGNWHPGFMHGAVGDNVFALFRAWHGVALFYVIAMAFLGLHLGHGIWSSFQTLGLNHPAWNTLRWPLAIVTAVAMAAGFAIIPLAIWLGWI